MNLTAAIQNSVLRQLDVIIKGIELHHKEEPKTVTIGASKKARDEAQREERLLSNLTAHAVELDKRNALANDRDQSEVGNSYLRLQEMLKMTRPQLVKKVYDAETITEEHRVGYFKEIHALRDQYHYVLQPGIKAID
jgi:hypothetical protein